MHAALAPPLDSERRRRRLHMAQISLRDLSSLRKNQSTSIGKPQGTLVHRGLAELYDALGQTERSRFRIRRGCRINGRTPFAGMTTTTAGKR